MHLYALIFCRKVKFSRFLKFSIVMICQNVLSFERGSYQSEILLVEVIVAADFEPIKFSGNIYGAGVVNSVL